MIKDENITILNDLDIYLNKNITYDYLITTAYGANLDYCSSSNYRFVISEFFGKLKTLLKDESQVTEVLNYINKLILQLVKKRKIYSKSENSYKQKLASNIKEVIEKLKELIIPFSSVMIEKSNPTIASKKKAKDITSKLTQKQVSIIAHYLNGANIFKPFITDLKVFEAFSDLTGFSPNTIKAGDHEVKKNEMIISEESFNELIEIFENIIRGIKRDIKPKKNKA